MLATSQIDPSQLNALGESELSELATMLLAQVQRSKHEIDWRDAKLEKLAYEIAHLRRMKFSARSEQRWVKFRSAPTRSPDNRRSVRLLRSEES